MASLTSHVIGNWKMNGSRDFVAKFFEGLGSNLDTLSPSVKVGVCPPFTLIGDAAEHCAGSSIALGAQDASEQEAGAYTGQISAAMLAEWGVQQVILGHSERREHQGETSEQVAQKALSVLAAGMQPVICVGETAEQRRSGKAQDIVGQQLAAVVSKLSSDQLSKSLIAYEPVWAIGTGETATPEQAQDMHAFIKEQVSGAIEGIIYGGSVKADNAAELFAQPDIQGALVGGASLDPNEFISICQAADQS